MQLIDFNYFIKQKKIFSVVEEIHTLLLNLDSVEKIEDLKESLYEYYELKNGNSDTI